MLAVICTAAAKNGWLVLHTAKSCYASAIHMYAALLTLQQPLQALRTAAAPHSEHYPEELQWSQTIACPAAAELPGAHQSQRSCQQGRRFLGPTAW